MDVEAREPRVPGLLQLGSEGGDRPDGPAVHLLDDVPLAQAVRAHDRLLLLTDGADARLLRLSLFQVSVGMATVLLIGTLNRVMIVELGVAAWLVAALVALPILVAPLCVPVLIFGVSAADAARGPMRLQSPLLILAA